MRSIPQALTWEMLSQGRFSMPAAALGAIAIPSVLFAALRQEGALHPEEPHMISMHVVLTLISWLAFGAAIFTAQGKVSRLYAYPLPTSTLVLWHMLPAMAAMALGAVATTAALNALFQLNWPLWGPALFAATAIAWLQAVLWLTEKSIWLPFVMGLVAAALGLWLKSRYGLPWSMPVHYWRELLPGEVFVLALASLAAFAVGIAAVSRNRHGDPLESRRLIAFVESLFDPAPALGQPFRSPQQAQFWSDWRQKGWAMPAAVIMGMVMGIGAWLIFSRDTDELFKGFLAGGMLLSAAGMVGGMLLGNTGPNDANYGIGSFLATRPLATPDMARVLLNTAARGVFLAWVLWVAGFSIVYFAMRLTPGGPDPTIPNDFGWWYLPMTLLGPWIVLAMVGSICLSGRTTLFVILLFVTFASYILLTIFAHHYLSRPAQAQLGHATTIAVGAVMLAASLGMFIVARCQELVDNATVCACLAVWAAATLVIAYFWRIDPVGPLSAYVLLTGLAALVVAPFAAAPLALHWNRVR